MPQLPPGSRTAVFLLCIDMKFHAEPTARENLSSLGGTGPATGFPALFDHCRAGVSSLGRPCSACY